MRRLLFEYESATPYAKQKLAAHKGGCRCGGGSQFSLFPTDPSLSPPTAAVIKLFIKASTIYCAVLPQKQPLPSRHTPAAEISQHLPITPYFLAEQYQPRARWATAARATSLTTPTPTRMAVLQGNNPTIVCRTRSSDRRPLTNPPQVAVRTRPRQEIGMILRVDPPPSIVSIVGGVLFNEWNRNLVMSVSEQRRPADMNCGVLGPQWTRSSGDCGGVIGTIHI